MLREVSPTLKERVEECGDKTVHYWVVKAFLFTTDRLIKFADEVKTVLGKKNYAKKNALEY